MSKKIPLLLATGVIVLLLIIALSRGPFQTDRNVGGFIGSLGEIAGTRSMRADFSEDTVLEETGKMSESKSGTWWLNSGAYLYQVNGAGTTFEGDLPSGSKWQLLYAKSDPGETDNGIHPQNIFRLVTRSKWQNFVQQAYFKIDDYHLSTDPNRSGSNGIFFFNRYQDGDNLYYTGVRVDGAAVIKKKNKGVYYTLAHKTVFAGKYDRSSNPNLLPSGTWIGLRSEVVTGPGNAAIIRLYIDREFSGNWELVLETKDDGSGSGGKAITGSGYAGIRTDFMDAQFDDYLISDQ